MTRPACRDHVLAVWRKGAADDGLGVAGKHLHHVARRYVPHPSAAAVSRVFTIHKIVSPFLRKRFGCWVVFRIGVCGKKIWVSRRMKECDARGQIIPRRKSWTAMRTQLDCFQQNKGSSFWDEIVQLLCWGFSFFKKTNICLCHYAVKSAEPTRTTSPLGCQRTHWGKEGCHVQKGRRQRRRVQFERKVAHIELLCWSLQRDHQGSGFHIPDLKWVRG